MEIFRFLGIVLQLVFLESILSLDNAVVLAGLAARLPATPLPQPWHRFFGRRLLGNQPQAALRLGLIAAYLGRALMILAATFIIRHPVVKVLGGGYLLWLSGHHLYRRQIKTSAKIRSVSHLPAKFWPTVLALTLSDFIFSIDNVIAAVSLSRNFWLVFLGVGLGMLFVRLAAGAAVKILKRWPQLIQLAYLLILALGLELLTEVFFGWQIGDIDKLLISALTIGLGLLLESGHRLYSGSKR